MRDTLRLGVLVLSVMSAIGCGRNKSGASDPGPDGTPTPPEIGVAVAPNPADKGQLVTIDASASAGDFLYFVFDYGDGSPTTQQVSPIATHVYDVLNYQDTNYTVQVTGYYTLASTARVEKVLMIKDLPPSVADVSSGLDGKAVIGEWIAVSGKNFLTVPSITVDGVVATAVELIDGDHLRFRVPPASRAGVRDLSIAFTGYGAYSGTLDVKRFAVATSAQYDKVHFLDVSANETITDTGYSLDVPDASIVKISPDGSTAYVDNGRFQFLSTGTITVIDLTAEGNPAIAKSLDVGNGPLYDIEVAPNAPVMIAGDSLGMSIFDIRNPIDPVQVGYTSILLAGDPLNDIVTCDLAISDAGTKVVALSALSHEARIFSLSGFVVTNPTNPVRVTVGEKTQDAAISDDGTTLYVLGGGGEGAFPIDLTDSRAANVTAVDFATSAVKAGPYRLSDLNGNTPVAPIPFDLAVSKSNSHKIYVTTVDQGFTSFYDKLTLLFDDPSFTHLFDLIVFLQTDGLNLGKTVPVNFADSATPSLGAPMQETLTAPTSADVLYNDHRMLQTSFRVWYDDNAGEFMFETGLTAINLQAGNVSTYIPLTSETISFESLFGLFQPPFSFGDVVFQP